jgi:hypothetical protein
MGGGGTGGSSQISPGYTRVDDTSLPMMPFENGPDEKISRVKLGLPTQGKRKKKCAEVWYVTVKIIDS